MPFKVLPLQRRYQATPSNQDAATMTFKPSAHRIDSSRKRSTGPSCRGGASSLLRLSRPHTQSMIAGPRRTTWLQRAAAYFHRAPVLGYPAFGVSEYGVGSTG
ncbi:MAG: hypothetical protein ABL900_01880 [Burkholderiaceae bacterium]